MGNLFVENPKAKQCHFIVFILLMGFLMRMLKCVFIYLLGQWVLFWPWSCHLQLRAQLLPHRTTPHYWRGEGHIYKSINRLNFSNLHSWTIYNLKNTKLSRHVSNVFFKLFKVKAQLSLKGHGNEADFLGFLQKSVQHRFLTLNFEPFRFGLRIRGDIPNRKTTPRLAESGSRQECL
jgi:hypothetical protein